MARLRGFFITGTDTGVGKTWASCGLIVALRRRGWRVIGMKPVASGCERTPQGLRSEDALRLQAVTSVALPYEFINPYAFEPAVAPHIAAREADVDIAFFRIRRLAETLALQADCLVVEGAGGWRVPLGEDGDMAALAGVLSLPVILVVGVRLGCLNHAFLSAAAIADTGLPLAGWIANLIDPAIEHLAENLDTLGAGIPAPCLGIIPRLRQFQPERLADCLHPERLPCGG